MMFVLLQILRGVAASMVVGHHYVASQVERDEEVRPWIEGVGGSGVDIFFVISGFIMMMTQSDPQKTNSARQFLWRRLVRIAPLYWVLTLTAVLLALVASGEVNTDFSLQKALTSLLFLPFGSGIDMELEAHTAYVIPMAWTLTYEWYFYLVFALTLAVGLKPMTRIGVMATWFTLCIAIGYLFQPTSLILQMATNPIVLEFLLGCLVAILYRKGYRLNGLQAIALGILASLMLGNMLHETALERLLLWGVPAFILIAAASLYQAGRLDFVMLRPFVRLGDISYSLYLSHFFCLALFVRMQDRSAYLQEGFSPLSLMIFMVLVLVVAEVCYRCIEAPARTYFSKQRQSVASMTTKSERT
jgi:exopolysaccharide production protein ExoZ